MSEHVIPNESRESVGTTKRTLSQGTPDRIAALSLGDLSGVREHEIVLNITKNPAGKEAFDALLSTGFEFGGILNGTLSEAIRNLGDLDGADGIIGTLSRNGVLWIDSGNFNNPFMVVERPELLRVLLDNGIHNTPVEEGGGFDDNCLTKAAREGNIELFSMMDKAFGEDRNDRYVTYLIVACINEQSAMLDFLLEARDRFNIGDIEYALLIVNGASKENQEKLIDTIPTEQLAVLAGRTSNPFLQSRALAREERSAAVRAVL